MMNKNHLFILLIEDSEDDEFLIKKELEKGNFIVDIDRIETEEEFINKLNNDKYNLIISDYYLPIFSGKEALRIYNETGVDVPFIVVSGRIGEETAVEIMREGAKDYIMKDNLKRLLPAVKRELSDFYNRNEIKKAKNEITKNKEKYKIFFENSGAASIILDGEMTIVIANMEFFNLTNYKKDNVIKKMKLFSIIADNRDKEVISEKFWKSKLNNDNKKNYIEVRILDNEKRIIHVLMTFANIKTTNEQVCLMFDIRERIRYEENIKNSEERFSKLFNLSPDVNILLDNKSLQIKNVNKKFEEKLGIIKNKIINKKITYLPIWKSENDIIKIIESVKDNNSVNNYELVMEIVKGRQSHFIWAGGLINVKGEELIFLNGKDITELKTMEKSMRHSQKLESIGTLAGGIAHDFNNILAVIFGYTELAKMNLIEDEKNNRYFDEIIKAGNRAKELINQILSFSREKEGKKRPIYVNLILKETIELIKATIPSTITIKRNIESGIKVMADPVQLHQIFMNLFTNSYQAMKNDGGVISVILNKRENKEIHGSITKNICYADITIKDTGIGIESENLERIFEPFFTTKEVDEGTGLGLAVVHGIVTSYGGTIDVKSKKNFGTEIKISIPITDVEEEESEKPFNIINDNRHIKILLVEDEESLALMMKEALIEKKFKVDVFTNSINAYEHFKEHWEEYGLVITDQTMPNMTGLELSKKMKRINLKLPIILQSGYSEAINTNTLENNGIDYYIQKPISMNDLFKHINLASSHISNIKERKYEESIGH